MSERLCSCCLRRVPLNQEAYLEPITKYGPGVCELCLSLPGAVQMSIHRMKTTVNGEYLLSKREDIIKALFSTIGGE